MKKNKSVYVKSKFTGGHYAMKTERSLKPFQNPMGVNSSIKLNDLDIVADIGAYVGEYSIWASKKVKKVYSYEPTPYTFEVLKMNKKHNMEIFNSAVVGNDNKHIDLFISKGIGVTNSTVKSQSKAGAIKVNAIKYENAIKDATVVKIDVEGGEYSFDIIQPQLRAIILEFHPIVKKPWKKWAYKIMENLEDAGFKSVSKKPAFKHGWDLTGSWVR